MNGFYLKVKRDSNSGLQLRLLTEDISKNGNNIESDNLYVIMDDFSRIVQTNGRTLFCIGTLIYENVWQENALKLIAKDLNSGKNLNDIIVDTRGQFCLIIHTDSTVFIVTDKVCSFPVYELINNNSIQISNIFPMIVKQNHVTINPQAIAEYISFDYCIDCTFFNEINYLDIGTVYQFGKEKKKHSYYNFFSNISSNKHRKLNEVYKETLNMIKENLFFLSADDKIFLDITGGFDTRTIATILKSMGLKYDSGICGEQVLQEAELAQKVAETLDVEHCSDYKIENKNDFISIVNNHFQISSGIPLLYHSSELINYYKTIKQNYDIHLTGLSGTELLTQIIPKLILFSKRINIQSLFVKLYKYKDIFYDDFMSQKKFYNTLEKKLISILKILGSDVHENVATFLFRSTYSRYYHGSLIGVHDIIMPFYSPFIESNFIRLMIETSYKLKSNYKIQRKIISVLNQAVSLIMTSHGYNANIHIFKNINILKRNTLNSIKNLIRRFLYQFRVLSRILGFIKKNIMRIKTIKNIEETQRSFWVNEVSESWSNNMQIFDIIDTSKLNCLLDYDSEASKLKAKVLYLNRLIELSARK